ncbi:cobalamin biosynthesis protein CobQ [Tabrizicola sp.]|uniref:cobalamin biosynthesis protein CobQ n=1 Tax=Tabrizicola sp. TaxID=2005166 RepID=UPI0035B25459
MFAMVLWATRVVGVPEHEVFGTLFFSETWQAVFAVDHGFLVWGALFASATWRGKVVLRAFAGAGLLHAIADFMTHHDDARRQFWPVSDWVFRSPVSYWDARFYGSAFGMFEVALVVTLAAFLCWRMAGWRERLLVLAVATPVLLPFLMTGSLHGLHGMG